MNPLRTAIVLMAIVAATPSPGATPPPASVVDDFSNTINTETSLWSYRFGGIRARALGSYTLFSTQGNGDVFSPETPYWSNTNPFLGVGVNRSGAALEVPAAVDPFLLPDQVAFLFPQPSDFAVVSWLSPHRGLVNIDYEFANVDDNGFPRGWR